MPNMYLDTKYYQTENCKNGEMRREYHSSVNKSFPNVVIVMPMPIPIGDKMEFVTFVKPEIPLCNWWDSRPNMGRSNTKWADRTLPERHRCNPSFCMQSMPRVQICHCIFQCYAMWVRVWHNTINDKEQDDWHLGLQRVLSDRLELSFALLKQTEVFHCQSCRM